MKRRVVQSAGFLLGALLAIGVLHIVSFSFDSVGRNLEAALGAVPIPVIRDWQNQGGFARDLLPGMHGADVVLLQRWLATDTSIYPEQKVTGYFADVTTAAIVRLQTLEHLPVSGAFDKRTRNAVNALFFGQLCPTAPAYEQDLSLAHVTREQGLPSGYVPLGLTDVSHMMNTDGVICVTQPTAEALMHLMNAAAADGVALQVCSGYRSPDLQEFLAQLYLAQEGDEAEGEVAQPFHSEHQTGTAVDFAGASDGFDCAAADFGATPEAAWLDANAWKYGFNMSYPATSTTATAPEYVYEPWHWRYLGDSLASELHTLGIAYNTIDPIEAALYSMTSTTTQPELQ